ncbi:MAG: DUF2336 domain-containing protein [Rhizobiales bacterium]|nr:DUF2336 domain-containing protein [Hyphomicrobiales bacterium]
MAASERSLIAEIEDIFASGSVEKQAEILRGVTDLFLVDANNYSDEHIDLFDGVISRLAEKIETKARAELAHRLAPADNAPPNTVRMLARDRSIAVAGPILSQSNRLTEEDLLSIANDKSQDRLLAISKRTTISEKVSDALVTHGDRDVVLSVSQNEGARFSDAGYGELIDRSINDEVLAICVATRKDIPRGHFNTLIAKASEVVFEKLAASNPDAVYEVHRVLTDITGQDASAQANVKRDYREAAARFDIIRRSGAPVDPVVRGYASGGKFEETVAALSALSGAPSKLVESVMNDARPESDFALILAKSAGLSWPTAKQICILRRKAFGLSPSVVEAARRSFERLLPTTAKRLVHFYNARHSAVSDFQQLAKQIGAQKR